MSEGDKMLTVKEVAEFFACSVRKVWRLVAAKELPQPVKIGRSCRWDPSEVQRYLEERKKARTL